jgi:poly(A) polymerase Pap1
MKVTYEDTCILESENGTEVPAEILNFVPKKYLSVAVNQAVKVNLHYTEKQGVYLGKMAGLEITSDGPKETVTYSDRRRG